MPTSLLGPATDDLGPGVSPRPLQVTGRLQAALDALPPSHRPRTRHYDGHEHRHLGEYADPYAPAGAKPSFTNRLLLEASPYLRQHAHNPVDWWPWGVEAFEEARRRQCPIFLSIGYSTCHWCHVMEHESFEDLDVARLLNERYVAVKVDREERPDVDAVYMTALQATQGGGGWPMSVWLAPGEQGVQGLPFFAGTYFPPRAGHRGQRMGFLEVLAQLADLYAQDPARVLAHGQQVADAVRQHLGHAEGAKESGALVGTAATDRVVGDLARSFDVEHGGRRGQPKFPSQTPVPLLLRHAQRTGESASLHMAAFTLRKMAAGGIYDHVGGGWHRYSTDSRWFAPHFEKMLYDQGLITLATLECLQMAPEPGLEDVVRGTLDYLLREMRQRQGGFFSATDADSEGREGLFFLWTLEQLREVLGDDEARMVALVYGATAQGNFEHSNILHRTEDWPAIAQAVGITEDALRARLKGPLEKLYRARLQRIPPLRDDKIQASWNGLAISAFARAGLQLREPRYVQAAGAAATFVLDHLRKEGRLVHAWLDGQMRTAAGSHHGTVGRPSILDANQGGVRTGPEAYASYVEDRTAATTQSCARSGGSGVGFLDDHAFLVQGLLDLLEATGDARWLDEALALQEAQDRHFAHPQGGWFTTADDAETLLARARPDHDGAEPSGNSVGARNLVRLAVWTGQERFRDQAEATVRAFGDKLRSFPAGLSEMLLAVEGLHATWREVVLIAAPGKEAELEPFVRAVMERPTYHTIVVAVTEGAQLDALAQRVPVVRERTARGGVTAYVCREGTCGLPVSDVAGLLAQLR